MPRDFQSAFVIPTEVEESLKVSVDLRLVSTGNI